jgi:transcriptional regulator of arginine metabolism
MHTQCILLHEANVNKRGARAIRRGAYREPRRWLTSGARRPEEWQVDKKRRQRTILELVATQPVASQEELRQLLASRGLQVTQSTLSRDLRDLRLARIPTPQGPRYASPDAAADSGRNTLEDVLPQFFASSDGVGELLVLKTLAGGAQPTAEAIDARSIPDVLGTIAGENTVLVICRTAAARDRIDRQLTRMAHVASNGR